MLTFSRHLSVAPRQSAQLGNPESPSVEEAQQNSISAMRLKGEQAVQAASDRMRSARRLFWRGGLNGLPTPETDVHW